MTTLRLATPADDAVLRRFLRGHGMNKWVEMAIEREPSFFAGRDMGGDEWAVVAEDEENVVGMYSAAVRPIYVNGRAERVGYLGGLRVSPGYRHRIRYLRQGYASIGALAPAQRSLPWWFTVVATENVAARKLLEAGVKGLPAYHPLGDYATYAVPTSRGIRRGFWRRARGIDLDSLIGFHAAQGSRFDLAPVLDAALVARIGVDNFLVLERDGALRGVAALWDQRSFKQIVAARYRRPIGSLVPAYNLFAKFSRRIPLPRERGALEHSFVAFLCLSDELRSESTPVFGDLLSHARTPIVSLGLHSAHPLKETVEALKPVRYPVRVYSVSFAGAAEVGGRPIQPEAALL